MKPRRSWRTRLLVLLGLALLGVVISVVAAVVVSIRVETGTWRVPQEADFVRVARRLDTGPSKTIFLDRAGMEIRPGDDDAATGVSSVLSHAAARPVRTRAWTGGDARWKQLTQCVAKTFAPFDVAVTDQQPTSSDFLRVLVGGAPADIGIKDKAVAGLAPFNGGVIPRAVVFAFSAQTGNDVRSTCETIAMEVAHAYGLDHEYLCKDVMTYLGGCGAKLFVDADVPCGESKKRACEGGAATQNSFRKLVGVLGAHVHR